MTPNQLDDWCEAKGIAYTGFDGEGLTKLYHSLAPGRESRRDLDGFLAATGAE